MQPVHSPDTYDREYDSAVIYTSAHCNAAVTQSLEDTISIDRADVPTINNTASINNAHKSDLNITESRTVDNDHRICDGLFNVISNQPSRIHDNKIIIVTSH